jgi:hypothetical protein
LKKVTVPGTAVSVGESNADQIKKYFLALLTGWDFLRLLRFNPFGRQNNQLFKFSIIRITVTRNDTRVL